MKRFFPSQACHSRWIVVGLAICLSLCFSSSRLMAADKSGSDWLQFRGPKAGSVVSHASLPTKFGGEDNSNIAWKVPLPGRSVCGPIVIGDQVVTTSSDGIDQRRIHLISVGKDSGKILWHQEFVARGRPFCHPTSANAAPTPASDGRRVYALYSSNDLVCVDLQGDLVWYRSLSSAFPKAANDVGMSSSPIVMDGAVIVQVECQGDSFVAGLDADTGKVLWKRERPKAANWSSPTPVTLPNGEAIVVIQSMMDLTALSPKTGEVRWKIDARCSTIPSSLAIDNRLIVPINGMTAYDLSSAGSEPSMLWENTKLGSQACSPLVMADQLFTVKSSVLACADIYSGELKWQMRLPDANQIWSSPVVANNHLYLFTLEGKCFVVKIDGTEGTIVNVNALGEEVLGSPAISQNAMFVRGVSHLWKIADK